LERGKERFGNPEKSLPVNKKEEQAHEEKRKIPKNKNNGHSRTFLYRDPKPLIYTFIYHYLIKS
jgi:hypothetical protein